MSSKKATDESRGLFLVLKFCGEEVLPPSEATAPATVPAAATTTASAATPAPAASATGASAAASTVSAAVSATVPAYRLDCVAVEVGFRLVGKIAAAFDGQRRSRCFAVGFLCARSRSVSTAHLGALFFENGLA